jgi:sodium-coupled monocarboxylate transporter 8/12
MVTDQISVQRYLTATSLKDAQKALWFKLWVTLPLVAMFYLTGTVLYGFYRAQPSQVPAFANAQLVPDLPQPAEMPKEHRLANDQLLPYFVVNHLPTPLPGLLIAALFGATMAVVSAGINSLATAALMDFRRTPLDPENQDPRHLWMARFLTLFFGVLATALAMVIGRLGTLVQITVTVMGLFGGPLLGIFLLGVLSRRANGNGALVGAAAGALTGVLVAFWLPLWDAGQYIAASFGFSPGLDICVSCRELFPRGFSFLWIAASATLITAVLGFIASLFFPAPDLKRQALVYRPGMRIPGT